MTSKKARKKTAPKCELSKPPREVPPFVQIAVGDSHEYGAIHIALYGLDGDGRVWVLFDPDQPELGWMRVSLDVEV